MPKFISDEEMAKLDPGQGAPATAKKGFLSDAEMEDISNPPSAWEAGGRGLAQGVTLGFGDEIYGAGSSGLQALKKGTLSDAVADYIRSRDEVRANNAKSQKAHPWAYGGGELVGGIAPALASGGSLAALAGMGATGAVGMSNSSDPVELAKEGLTGGATAYAGGRVLEAAAPYIGKALAPVKSGLSDVGEYISSKMGRGAENLSAIAQGAGKAEFKNGTAPRIGRFGLDNKVVTPLADTETMLARSQAAKEAAGKQMGGVYSQIDEAGASAFNPLDTAVKMEQELSPTYRTPINKSEIGQLDNTIESVLARGEGNIPLTEAQALKKEIGEVAFPGGKRPVNPTPKQQMAADAYAIVNREIDDSAAVGAKALNKPELTADLAQGKLNSGAGAQSENLLKDKLAGEKSGTGVLSKFGKMADVGLLATGRFGTFAAKKGLEYAGDHAAQTGAVVLDKSSKAVQALLSSNLFSEAQLSKLAGSPYFQALKSAGISGGSESVATAHYVLQQTEPGYQQLLKDTQD